MMLRLAVAVWVLMVAMAAQAAPDPKWSASLDLGLREAKRYNRLLLVEFATAWCSWCKKLEQETFADAKVNAALQKFALVRLDAEHGGREAAKKALVTGFPETVLMDSRGNVVGRIAGYLPPNEFLDALKVAESDAAERPKLEQRIAKDEKDAEALARLAAVLARVGELDKAKLLIARAETADPQNRTQAVARSLSQIGDTYQMAMRFADAIHFFQRAAKVAKTPAEMAYARLSVAACHISLAENDAAKKELQAVLATPGLSAKDRKTAEDMLKGLASAPTG